MANNYRKGAYDIRVDEVDLVGLLKVVQTVEKDLRTDINNDIRDAAQKCATVLAQDLMQASAFGPPQAALVASTIKVRRDRQPKVVIGGKKKVGRRGTGAGVLVWGSEHGSSGAPDRDGTIRNRFVKPRNMSGYWIKPTVDRFIDSKAYQEFYGAVTQILLRNGLI